MRQIVLCGTRSFGLSVLKQLDHDAYDIRAIVAPVGDSVAQYGSVLRVPVADRVTPELVEDAVVVGAHSHAFIGKRSREAAFDVFGYHPSLLPRHRGKDAVKWTIRLGDAIAGGTVYRFTHRIDGGPILAQEWCHVDPTWGPGDLWREELFGMGTALLKDVIDETIGQDARLAGRTQREEVATWEPSLDTAPLYRPELLELPAAAEERSTDTESRS